MTETLKNILERLENFVLKSNLPIDFFYRSLRHSELHLFREASANIDDHDTVEILNKEIERRDRDSE